MPILSSRISNITTYSNRFRARFEVTFVDLRVIAYGPTQFATALEATDFLSTVEARVLESTQNNDAQEAVRDGVTTATKEASEFNVQRAYLLAGNEGKDSDEVYDKLKPIEALLDGAQTDTALARDLEVRESEVAEARSRWTRVKANETEIVAYRAIK